MRSLAQLRNAYKLTKLTFPYKKSLNYSCVEFCGDYKDQRRCFASRISGEEFNGDEGFHEAFALLSLLRDNSRKAKLLTENLENLKRKKFNKYRQNFTNVKDGFRRGITNINHENGLNFDMEITNLKKSLFDPNNLIQSDDLKKTALSLPYNSITIPLHMNILLNPINPEVPEFNEHLTSMVANLCTVALRNGFSSKNSCRKHYCTKNTNDTSSNQKIPLSGKNDDDFKKVAPSSDEIVKDLLKRYDDFLNGKREFDTTSKVIGNPGKTKKPENSRVTKGVLNGLGLLDPQLYKKALKEAETKRKELAKSSASCKEKLNRKTYQSKKPPAKQPDTKNLCEFTPLKTSGSYPTTSEPVKHFESVTEPSSPFKCGLKKEESKECTNQKNQYEASVSKSKCEEKESACDSKKSQEKDPCEGLPKITSRQIEGCKSLSQKLDSKSKCDSASSSESGTGESCTEQKMPPDSIAKSKIKTMKSDQTKEVAKYSSNSEKKAETSSKCSSKSEPKAEIPCKIAPVTKSKSCSSSSGTEDPCKIPSIAFKKTPEPEISAKASKCSSPSPKSDCKTSKDHKPSSCASASASKCSPKVKNDAYNIQPEPTVSKCGPRNSCVTLENKPNDEADCDKACKRVGMSSKKSCDSEPKNPCKSPCASSAKPKPKCGRPPRGDTRPRCKKDSKCGPKKPPPCAPKEQPESKCGTEPKPQPSKCGSKACAPSPKTSSAEINPKSKCTKTAPSLESQTRTFHSLSNFSAVNFIFSRNYSDNCPEKPKSGYKLESEKSDEYRRETCENYSWKDTKSRKKRTNKTKNCYPEETKEFCPDTACYKVYAETSGKLNRKSSKSKPKGKSNSVQ